MTLLARILVVGVLLLGRQALAHDEEGDDRGHRGLKAMMVADADAGDFLLDSAGGSFIEIESEDGGEVKMTLTGVADAAGTPANVAMNQLSVTGLANGVAFTKTFLFDLVNGAGSVRHTLALAAGTSFEVQTVSASTPATGVFAVPGLGGQESGDEHGRHGHFVRGDRRGGRHNGEHRGEPGFQTSLVADADAGDFTIDSAAAAFLDIDNGNGDLKMVLTGVTNAGAPVDHAGNHLTIKGLKNGGAFTAVFPFDLRAGMGFVRGTLGLAGGEIVEIQTVAVDDGTNVFAVPGFLVGNDDDDDGVHDGGDDCDGTATDAMVDDDGCSLEQLCPCGDRTAQRACIRGAVKQIITRLRGVCRSGGRRACRLATRQLAGQRRQLIRSCRP